MFFGKGIPVEENSALVREDLDAAMNLETELEVYRSRESTQYPNTIIDAHRVMKRCRIVTKTHPM